MKYVSTLIASVLISICCIAQKPELFGFKLDSLYDCDTIYPSLIRAVGKTHYVSLSDLSAYLDSTIYLSGVPTTEYDSVFDETYFFVCRKESGNKAPSYSLAFSPSGRLKRFSIMYPKIFTGPDGKEYSGQKLIKHVADSLKAFYPLKKNGVSYQYENADYSILVSSSQTGVAIGFFSTYDTNRILASIRPTIQDTFFGFVLGGTYPPSEFISAFRQLGSFGDNKVTPQGRKLVFLNIPFGGRMWEFCTVFLSKTNVLIGIDFYNAFPAYNGSFYREAAKLYFQIKSILDEKYNSTHYSGFESRENGGRNTIYLGKNDKRVSVYNKIGKSSANATMRYVGINYMDNNAFDATMTDLKNEF